MKHFRVIHAAIAIALVAASLGSSRAYGDDRIPASYRAAYRLLGSGYRDRTFVILGTSHYGTANRFGLTRKWAIPLLEHLDSSGATRRLGDERMVVRPATPAAGASGAGA